MVVTVLIIILLATVLVIAALVAAGRADAAMEGRPEPAEPQKADTSDMHRHAVAESDPEPSLHVKE